MLAHSKEVRDDGAIVEIVVWEVPEPLRLCVHRYKYRLFYGLPGSEWVRYDSERGNGDHRHVAGIEVPYNFTSIDQLLDDFECDVDPWSSV